MKVAQKNPTNPNTRSVYLSDASNYLNLEHSPSGHLSNTGPEPGKHSRLTYPFIGIRDESEHVVRLPVRCL